MGTTAQKLQRVLDTKEGLKDTINTYLGQDITSAIPFKDYETYIKNFYGSLPKTSYAEGSNITLSNTLKGKLDFEDGIVGYGDISQKSTTGKNKLQFPYIDTSKTDRGITYVVNNDGTITASGTATDNSVFTLLNQNSTEFSNIRNLLLNNSCILNGCPSGGSSSYRLQLYGYGSAGGGALADYGSGVSLSNFANETNAFNVAIFIPTGTVISTPITFKPMIRLASVTDDTYEKYTGGVASPNSSYPQDIEVVRGKNLSKEKNGNNIVITDTLEAGTYTFSLDNTINGGFNLKSNSNSGTTLATLYFSTEGRKTVTFTLSQSTKVFINGFSNTSGTSFVEGTDNFQLEKGSQATSYLPYNTLEVISRGINRFNVTDYNNLNLIAQTGTTITKSTNKITILTDNKSSSGFYCTNNRWNTYIDSFVSGKTYTLSMDLKSNTNTTIRAGFEASPEQTSLTANTTKRIVTTTSNTSSAIVVYNTSSTANITIEVTNIMITEDSSQTTYEPYQTPQTYQLSLGEYEFAKIGNYVDTIEYDVDEDKVYKNEAIGKKVLNGGSDENWAYETAYNRFGLTETINDYNITLRTTAICNYYRYGDTSINNYFALSSNGKLALFHAPTNISTLAEWKTWLSTNNLILYYILATATREEITGTLKDQIKALYNSHSYTGTTIIEIDGQLPLIIKVRALKGE